MLFFFGLRSVAMFAVLTRSLARRTVSHSIRYMSKKPPANRIIRDTPEIDSAKTTPESAGDVQKKPSVEAEPMLNTQTGMPTLDFSPPEVGKETQRTGARSSKGSLSTSEKKRRVMGRVTLALLALGFGAHTVYMGREWEEEELKAMKVFLATPIRSNKNPTPKYYLETRRGAYFTLGPHQASIF